MFGTLLKGKQLRNATFKLANSETNIGNRVKFTTLSTMKRNADLLGAWLA